MNEARAPADRITSLDLTAAACIAALVWQKQMLAGPCACLMVPESLFGPTAFQEMVGSENHTH